MIQSVEHNLSRVDALRDAPAGLLLPVPAHRARSCTTDSVLLKKPFMAFSTSSIERRSRASASIVADSQVWKILPETARSTAFGRPDRQRGFQLTPIFNGLQPPKMAVHPCTGRSYISRTIERAALGTETDSPTHS